MLRGVERERTMAVELTTGDETTRHRVIAGTVDPRDRDRIMAGNAAALDGLA